MAIRTEAWLVNGLAGFAERQAARNKVRCAANRERREFVRVHVRPFRALLNRLPKCPHCGSLLEDSK